MKRFVALFLVAAAIIGPAHAQLLQGAAPAEQSLDRIVAVANDDVILQSELNQAVQSVQQQYAAHPDQLPPVDVLRKQVLQRLIMMRLQVQKALDQGIHISEADVDQAVDGVAKQNKITADQLRAEIERTGSFAQFRQQLAEQL
ncbi:MAG: SurA N-terminal domain-containing protein, partial [Rhodanobacter sp.]